MSGKRKTKEPYKYCFVPGCKSTSIKTPEKEFISVPKNEEIRKIWCMAAGVYSKLRNRSAICEDHFNLAEDLDNYLEWKMVNRRKRLKVGVYPRFFDCQLEPSKPVFVKCNRPVPNKNKKVEADPLDTGETAAIKSENTAFEFVEYSKETIDIKQEFPEPKKEPVDG